jgi:hypothetical protein
MLAPGFAIRNSRTSPELFRNAANRRVVHEFLSSPEVYWGQGRSQAVVDRQISSALICFGVFRLPLPEGDEGAMTVEFISPYSPIILSLSKRRHRWWDLRV